MQYFVCTCAPTCCCHLCISATNMINFLILHLWQIVLVSTPHWQELYTCLKQCGKGVYKLVFKTQDFSTVAYYIN